jgi:chromosome segregation protein
MHLQSLTLFGFKSFPDKTTLEFRRGITAVVGPNGCGKSNIADAIRWVLGEQSAKALRGEEMADVIFNGTDGRKPLNVAEVSLTVGGVEAQYLKAAGIELPYSEVTVTRRVFRDGSSEYFLNGTPCRLKDIQQLFAGTGMGRASYGIMAQGNITQIISSKPEDRRMVFEEAAGITRFKGQKREALRKLEVTEQNILRLEDVIREVKRQIISLQRQAGKARRYKQYMRDLQYLDTQLTRHQFDVLQAEITERQAQWEMVRGEMERCSGELLREEKDITGLRQRLGEIERAVSQSEQRCLQLEAEIEQHESRIQFNTERLEELAAQQARAEADIAEAEQRRQAAEQELGRVVEQLNGSLAKLEEQRGVQQERQAQLQSVEAELQRREAELSQAQAELFEAAQQLSRVRNESGALELQKQGQIVRLEKLSAEKAQLEEERARLEQRLQQFEQDSAMEKLEAQARRLTLEERQQRFQQLQSELGVITQELDRLQQEQAEKQSRLGLLEQLDSNREGFGAGALAALKNVREVLGTLADRIRVPAQFVPAIEAALGHHLQAVLTDQPEAACRILADLSAHKQGRASIASLALKNGKGAAWDAPPELSAGLASLGCVSALSAVEADASVQALLKALLERTQIVPDLPRAVEAWQAAGGQCDFVTHAGEVLSRHGVFTGGTANGSAATPVSILGRKNQIAELREGLAGLRAQVLELSRGKGARQSERTALEASLQQAQNELREREVALATRQGEFNALQSACRLLHQKIDTVVYEIQCLAEQQREGEQKRTVLSARMAELQTRENAAQQQVGQFNATLTELRGEREKAAAALTEARVALATQEQVCASFRGQQRPLEQRISELVQLAEQRRQEIARFGQRRLQAEAESGESATQAESLRRELEQAAARTSELREQCAARAADLTSREDGLRDRRAHLARLQEQRGAVEVEIAEKRMSVENLRERMRQKWQVNLDEIRSECIRITFAAEGPPKVVTLTPDEMAAAGVATDWNAVAEQAAALQKRIDEMGPINLVAVEEYDAAEERHQFLTAQHEDLVKARTQLLEVINRVNMQTRQMFNETFAQVRENFRRLFVEIFNGGKADLFLVDEGDVLESGIEIMARPPGKQLQSIALLSGGEQTMTAVALLFAIYQVKPSPFCVLDELDAPLDESNINCFIHILQRFLPASQFLVVTHSKRTIAMADVIYGITMEERGVSQMVSVRFRKAEEQVLEPQARPLETLPPNPPVEVEEDQVRTQEETIELATVS